ncbi:MAG TPA: triose-phosphate isomerase [Candidatus Deferrimicrobiaceae bacterium]|nr:triose-phosphate isomerase [Candidatus Deferrimicrobiaceae bacterium]
MRTPLIAGNWKMYKTAEESAAFAREFLPMVAGVTSVQIVLAPAFPSLSVVASLTSGTNVGVASQNIHFAQEGAYTGEVSPAMAKAAGARFAIIGHSERRQYFAETDESVNRKVKAAIAAGLFPILCVGETLPEREAGKTFEVVGRQLSAGLSGVPAADAAKVVVAYEPVWAIGTGKTATPAQAQEAHAFLRKLLKELWGDGGAEAVRILYGGSVKPENISDLMREPDIDGALVGGASRTPDAFSRIVKYT